jgi:GTP-binding protein
MVIAANKTDIPGEEDYLAQLKEALPEYEIFPISAATGEGLKPLVYRLMELVEQTELEVEEVTPTEEVKVTKAVEDEVKFVIEQDEFGVFVVSGPEIERQWRRTNFVNEDAVSRFLQIVEAMGVVKALREQGCQDGDTVRIKDVEFDFVD